MKNQIELSITPDEINLPGILSIKSCQELKVEPEKISAVIPLRKSIDARSKHIVFRILVDVYLDEKPEKKKPIIYNSVNSIKK
ncbi:MAG: FAD-binding protein, partial [Ignavibacteriales bacterium]